VVFDGAPSMLTQQVARELYDLEADEVMGAPPADVIGGRVPEFGTAAA
jgi:phosphonate transport system ATP-binding protein